MKKRLEFKSSTEVAVERVYSTMIDSAQAKTWISVFDLSFFKGSWATPINTDFNNQGRI